MAEWHIYNEPLEILTSEDINNIHENVVYIKDLLVSKGYSVKELADISASIDSEYIEVTAILFNMESNLNKINDNDAKSAFYGSKFIWEGYASNYDDIWRWIQILNDMYDILNNIQPKWATIRCLNGYPTIDDRKLIARGDYID